MNESMLAFLEIVKAVTPYAISWALGIRAFNFIVGAFTGRDVRL